MFMIDSSHDEQRICSETASEQDCAAGRFSLPLKKLRRPVIDPDAILPDDLDDLIGARIVKWRKHDSRRREALQQKAALVSLCERFGYRRWRLERKDYLLRCVGDVQQYDVPLNKQGRLSLFRGQRVRMICIGSGAFDVDALVGPVPSLRMGGS